MPEQPQPPREGSVTPEKQTVLDYRSLSQPVTGQSSRVARVFVVLSATCSLLGVFTAGRFVYGPHTDGDLLILLMLLFATVGLAFIGILFGIVGLVMCRGIAWIIAATSLLISLGDVGVCLWSLKP